MGRGPHWRSHPHRRHGTDAAELFEEVEAVKHFILGVPKGTPVEVDFVYEPPGGRRGG